jgi:hypothetical protein
MASLQEARRDREEAVTRMAEEDEAASNRESHGGIVENIEKGARSLLDAVTGATRDKAQEACDKVRKTKDATKEKAGEMKDGVQDSMEETKEKASEAKDRDTLKLMDYEDGSQGKGGMSEKVGEYKESAAEAARKAREFLVEGKEEARVQLAGKTKVSYIIHFLKLVLFIFYCSYIGNFLRYVEMKDHKGQTNESARKHLEDVKQRSAEKLEEGRGMLDEPHEGDKYVSLFNFIRLKTVLFFNLQ